MQQGTNMNIGWKEYCEVETRLTFHLVIHPVSRLCPIFPLINSNNALSISTDVKYSRLLCICMVCISVSNELLTVAYQREFLHHSFHIAIPRSWSQHAANLPAIELVKPTF